MLYDEWYSSHHNADGEYIGPKHSGYISFDEHGDAWDYHTKRGDVEDWTPALVGPLLSTGFFFV
jgi:hypothetical protein